MSKIRIYDAIARVQYILSTRLIDKQDALVAVLRDRMLLDCDADEDVDNLLMGVIHYLKGSLESAGPEWAYTRHVMVAIEEVLG